MGMWKIENKHLVSSKSDRESWKLKAFELSREWYNVTDYTGNIQSLTNLSKGQNIAG